MTRLFASLLVCCFSGLALTKEADVSTTGPAYLILTDPDGNPVLIDQHVPKPGK